MRVLGAIIAGGLSTRFGSDKAFAMIDGCTMIEHAIDALRPQVEALVLCGREQPGIETISDRPARRIGPLGGLNAALHHAARTGHHAVLCIPVDVWPLPADLRERLVGDGPAVFVQQYLIGFWPTHLAATLDRHIANGAHSLRSWIIGCNARAIVESRKLLNINRRDDFDAAALATVRSSREPA